MHIDDDGLLYTVPNSVRDADPLFRIPKIDLSSAQIKVKTNGELVVIAPPSDPSAIADEYYYLQSPGGIYWKLTVNVQNYIVTQAYLNAFLVRSENVGHFAVKQTDPTHALVYMQVYNAASLPATLPGDFELIGMLPFVFYDNGTTKRPIYHNGTSWLYVHDNSVVS